MKNTTRSIRSANETLRLQWQDAVEDGDTALPFHEYLKTNELRPPYDLCFQTMFTDGEVVEVDANGIIVGEFVAPVARAMFGLLLAIGLAAFMLAALLMDDSKTGWLK